MLWLLKALESELLEFYLNSQKRMKLLNQLIVVAAYSYAQEGSGSNSQDEEGRVDKAYHFFIFKHNFYISFIIFMVSFGFSKKYPKFIAFQLKTLIILTVCKSSQF